MDAPLVRVLPSAELETETPGEPRLKKVTVGEKDILLGRLSSGPVVAFASNCPHQNTQLDGATFFDGRVRCPLHVYLYDPRTGENIVPARDANPDNLWKLKPGYLPVYEVEERDGWIWIGAAPKPPPAAYDPALEVPPAPGDRPGAAARARAAAAAADDGPLDHGSKTLRVAPGTTFDLRLPTAPRPGFIWRVETEGPLLAVVEERFEPGDPPRHLVRIAARGEGETTLRCLYARPWDKDPAEVRTYVVRVEFT
ncbi:MAG TPA: protease inhibitor I42 family protein [Acidimicrobiales bacterium]|nr:protease inhibitor I42 family protein [Acidimicrobiales bacterium]